jgi:hypothetical protein
MKECSTIIVVYVNHANVQPSVAAYTISGREGVFLDDDSVGERNVNSAGPWHSLSAVVE